MPGTPRLVLATRQPEQFVHWVQFLSEHGIGLVVAVPERREVGRALESLRAPALLLDVRGGGYQAPGSRQLVRELGIGGTVGIIAVTRSEQMLAADSETFDDVLEAGATPEEVLYRARMLTQRKGEVQTEIVAGEVAVQPDEGLAFLRGRRLLLSGQELLLLQILAARPNRVLTRSEVARAIWGPDFEGNLRSVDAAVCRLRKRLGDYGQRHLQTVARTGYVLHSPEEPARTGRGLQ